MKLSNLFYASIIAVMMLNLLACTTPREPKTDYTPKENIQDGENAKEPNEIPNDKGTAGEQINDGGPMISEPPPKATTTAPSTQDLIVGSAAPDPEATNPDDKVADNDEEFPEDIIVGSAPSFSNDSVSESSTKEDNKEYKVDLMCNKNVYVKDTFILKLSLKKIINPQDTISKVQEHQVNASKNVSFVNFNKIKIKLEHAGLIMIKDETRIDNDCIELKYMGNELEVLYKLVALERGNKEISATIYKLSDDQDCKGYSAYTVGAEKLDLFIDVNYKSNLWLTLWENIQKFWAALLIAVFSAILLFVKRKLKLKEKNNETDLNPKP